LTGRKKMKMRTRAWMVALALLVAAPAYGAKEDKRPFTARLAVKVYEQFLKIRGFKPGDLKVHSIGHSHIDAAWKWRVPETHGKVFRTFRQAVENMETRPDFTFSQSQPALYEWILEERPDLFAKMVEMEKQGRWEITGGMWVEPDSNMPGGEAFVRQRLLGQRFFLTHFGHIADIAWLPDSFGYNLNLPQIFTRSGAKYLWAKKIGTNKETVFPFQHFVWRSPDGSEVLTSLNTMSVGLGFFCYQEVGKFKDSRWLVKPGVELVANYRTPPAEIKAALSDDWMNEIGNFYGEGDGDQGPNYIEVEIQEALRDRGYTVFTDAKSFFRDVETYKDRLPVWEDELYLERHRGVQTTQAWIKRANRLAESMMLTAEALHSINGIYGGGYPLEAIKRLWKMVCFHQFHDILPGSSIPEVYEDARKEYAKIERGTREVIDSGLAGLAARVDTRPAGEGLEPVLVFNPLGWERSGLVELELKNGERFRAYDGAGREMPSQVIRREDREVLAFQAADMPSLGYRVYFLKPDTRDSMPAIGKVGFSETKGALVLENDLVSVSVDKDTGWITSLVDRSTGAELINGSANKILAFYERAKSHRAWDINPEYTKHLIELPEKAEGEITSDGPLFIEISTRRELDRDGKLTSFDQKIRLMADDPVVYLDLDSDFHIEDSLIKVEFNTTINSEKISADGPYLVIERSTRPETARDKARWEMACQKWIDLSDNEKGLALLNNGKYGFSLNADGTGFRLSVIKGAEYPMPYADAVDVAHPREKDLPYTDQGRHHVEMGLLAHRGGWREAGLWKAGYEFNAPLLAVRTDPHQGPLPAEASFISLDSETSYIGAVKRAEDGNDLVVRLIEAAGTGGHATVRLGLGLKVLRAVETDLLELNPEPLDFKGKGVKLDIGPYQIRTLKIRVAD
jgi:alpha-mannosidase